MKINKKFTIAFFSCIALLIVCFCLGHKLHSMKKELDAANTNNKMLQTQIDVANYTIEECNDKIHMATVTNEKLNKQLASANDDLITANNTINELKNDEYRFVYLGDYKLTAYCACEICCEEWAINRPVDDNGNPIVYTASGTVATQGRTIGVDPKIIPYGTEVYIAGQGWFVAEDTGAIGVNHIDIYMDSHEAALSSGLTHGDVWMLVKES